MLFTALAVVLKNVPAVVELARTPEDRDVLAFYANSGAVGRAVIAPPGMPSERVAMLRSAFVATMKDSEFRAEIEATKLELEPMAGAELQALVEASTRVSGAVLARYAWVKLLIARSARSWRYSTTPRLMSKHVSASDPAGSTRRAPSRDLRAASRPAES